ncbi:hydroxylysine kinase-like isoform X1 [Amblyraja radiata]|uniref:hydroxylysine kinase-like isoform X1 n=2 Tax=Amblyraja radiata TaxID=386614 RepID=UPI001402E298|nr:hydroxylysine kinase-like isoform X1 [Amblyraja radiata]
MCFILLLFQMTDSDEAAVIRPSLSEAQVVELVGRLYGLKVSEVKPLPSYMDQNFHILVCETQEGGDHGESYVLKVLNTAESQDTDLVEVQTRVMMFLNQKGFPTATPITTIDGKILSLETISCGEEYKNYMVRLLTYLPGTQLLGISADPQILYKIGRTLAQINKVLTEFKHPNIKSLQRDSYIWNLSNTHQLHKYLFAVKNTSDRQIVEQIIQQFMKKILPNINNFHKSIIHGDFTHTNILVQPLHSSADCCNVAGHMQQELEISGILDFGDTACGYYVCDLAICIMHLMLDSEDPLHVGGHILAGFESVIPLTLQERDALYLLVLCRFSQSLVFGTYNILRYPDNEEYLQITTRTGWKHLRQHWDLGKEAVEKIWFETAKSYLTL